MRSMEEIDWNRYSSNMREWIIREDYVHVSKMYRDSYEYLSYRVCKFYDAKILACDNFKSVMIMGDMRVYEL